MTKDEATAALVAMGEAISAGDSACTRWPIWTVQELHRCVGMDPEYGSVCWVDNDGEQVLVDGEEFDRLEADLDENGEEPDNWTRTGYTEDWIHVHAFVTEAAATQYIATQSHRHSGELRIWVDSAHRNSEWRMLQEALLALAGAE